MEKVHLKVCGMRDPDNLRGLMELNPDYIGLIFYAKSARYVGNGHLELVDDIPKTVKKVGVFVKEPLDSLIQEVKDFKLDLVQLHGGESLEYCRLVKEQGIPIIKVFSVEGNLPMDEIKSFEEVASFFLFDTKTPKYGGSGQQFDWKVLKQYNLETPYFLSGGIGVEQVKEIDFSSFPGLHAIDINSKVEVSPAFKDLHKISKVKEVISNKQKEVL